MDDCSVWHSRSYYTAAIADAFADPGTTAGRAEAPLLTAAETARLFALVLGWAAIFHGLSAYAAPLLPRAFTRLLTLEAYLALVHLTTLVAGLLGAHLLLRRPRETLGLLPISGRAVGIVLGLLPMGFALVTTGAFLVARPTLLEELMRGGRDLVQSSTGRFGRELVESPALLALVWGAILSPVSEELFFRGAVWGLTQRVVSMLGGPSAAPEPGGLLPVEFLRASPVLGVLRAVVRWFKQGGAATLFVAALFGVVHRDMPGGLGIVRFASALGLGLACGLARQHAGSVGAAILLHVGWNVLSIAAVRRWIITEQFPMKNGAPTLVTTVGVVLAVVVALGALAFSIQRRTWRA